MTGVLEEVRAAAARMGSCDPRWLRNGIEPKFNFVREGPGPARLLCLHGLFGAVSNWKQSFPLMAQKLDVTALEFPILTAHRSEVKVKALAAYTEYFIRKHALQPINLCGNSLGGHVALRVALASPELVDCLVLSGPSGLYEHTAEALPVRPKEKFIRDHMGRVFYNSRFITDEAVNEILQILSSRTNHLNLIHAARSAKRDNLLQLLKQVQPPTLLLWGENDEVTTMDVAAIFRDNIPNARLATIDKCGHAPMMEYPNWFADRVQEFLAANSRSD